MFETGPLNIPYTQFVSKLTKQIAKQKNNFDLSIISVFIWKTTLLHAW